MSNLFDTVSDIKDEDNFTAADHLNKVILFSPLKHVKNFQTNNYGIKDPVKVNLTVIESETEGSVYEDVLLFQGNLIAKLKNRIGGRVLAVLTLGEAKGGQKPPYLLKQTTTEQEEMAVKYLMKGASDRSESKAPADDDPFAA